MNDPILYLSEKDIPKNKIIVRTFDPISSMTSGPGGNAMIEEAHDFLKEQIVFNSGAYNAAIIRYVNLVTSDNINFEYYALATPVFLDDKPE